MKIGGVNIFEGTDPALSSDLFVGVSSQTYDQSGIPVILDGTVNWDLVDPDDYFDISYSGNASITIDRIKPREFFRIHQLDVTISGETNPGDYITITPKANAFKSPTGDYLSSNQVTKTLLVKDYYAEVSLTEDSNNEELEFGDQVNFTLESNRSLSNAEIEINSVLSFDNGNAVPGIYTFEMRDSYGDGWQGSHLLFTIDGEEKQIGIPDYWGQEDDYGLTLEEGSGDFSSFTVSITVPDTAATMNMKFVSGNYPGEVSFDIHYTSLSGLISMTLAESQGGYGAPELIPLNNIRTECYHFYQIYKDSLKNEFNW